MRILLLSWNFPPALGGIEYVVENLYHGLKRAGHSVKLLTAYAPSPEDDEDVYRCPKKGLKSYVRFAFCEGSKIAREIEPEIIVNGSIASAPAAWLLSKRFRVPYVILMYGSDIKHRGWIYQRAVRFLSHHADGLATCSAHTQGLAIESGCRPERIRTIYPGVRLDNFVDVPSAGAEELVEYAQGRRVLLSVGRLIKRKGVLEFVDQVMPTLVDRHPEVLFYVVGDDATSSLAHKELMRDRIQAKVEELDLEHHVKLLGKVADADLIRLYFLADIFVLPCLEIPGEVEGFGIVLLEAALGGTASVATRTGGIPEAVQNGATGLLAEPDDFPLLAEHINTLLEDEARRRELADAGARRARECFSWDVIIGEYEKFFEYLVSYPGR